MSCCKVTKRRLKVSIWVCSSISFESMLVELYWPLNSWRERSMVRMDLALSMAEALTTTLVPGMDITPASQASPTRFG